VRETPEDLQRLQALLDRSIEGDGGFLRDSFQMPDRSLGAAQLVRFLRGIHNVAFATVTWSGEPRVAPIGALFLRGRFHVPTVATAARTRHLVQRPAVGPALHEGANLAVVVHGRAEVLGPDHTDFPALEETFGGAGGGSVLEWREGVYVRVEAEKLYTFARHPGRFPR